MGLLTLHEKAVSLLRPTVEILDATCFILEGMPISLVFLIVSHWAYLEWFPALKRFHETSLFFGLAWWSVWLIRGSTLLSRGVLWRIESTRLTFIRQIASTDSGSAKAFGKLHKWAAPCCRVRRISAKWDGGAVVLVKDNKSLCQEERVRKGNGGKMRAVLARLALGK